MNIPNIAYKDFLINQTKPERDNSEYVPFWLKHIEYCKSGVNVGGVHISGWLYWHINFFKIPVDKKDEYGNWTRPIEHPDFRDNEWYIDWGISKAQENQRPILIFGSRRISKSVTIASRAAYSAFIKPNSAVVIIGADSNDLANITEYLDDFYEKRPDCFSDLRKFGNWLRNTGAVEIAFSKRESTKKDPATGEKGRINPITSHLMEIGSENKYIYSRVAIRNLEHGQKVSKEELLAGLTPTEVIIDEVGKFSYSLAMSALKPALKAIDGSYRAIVIMAGTGGNIDVSSDAERDFLNSGVPTSKDEKTSGYVHIDVEDYKTVVKPEYFKYKQISNAQVGLFPPAEMSNAGGTKLLIPFSEYLNRDFTDAQLKDLEGFDIYVTDWENAHKRIEAEISEEEFKSDKEGKKAKMYYPFQPEDCFLYSGSNPFPVEELKRTRKRLKEIGATGEYVDLSKLRNGRIAISPSDKSLIVDYPFQGGEHDAPVVLYERPIHDDPSMIKKGVYVAGFDGYKIGVSETTDSVGSLHIFKRKSGISGYQYQIVASYASRPAQDKEFHKQCLYLLQLYNAEVLPESDTSFYKFMEDEKALGQYWANCKDLAQGINVNSKANTNYGLPPTVKNQQHYLKLIKQYCNEDIIIGYEETDDGAVPIKMLGCERLTDLMLIEELINFGKEKNYDRIISFGHALAWDDELGINNIIADDGKASTQVDIRRLRDKIIAKKRTSTGTRRRPSKYRRR